METQKNSNMKIVIHNEDNLKENEINKYVYRARGVIINSKNEILMGYMGGIYQFPGGHLEGSETLDECLIREISEETGINVTGKFSKPFYKAIYYDRDYGKKGINRYCEFNYYLIKTDDKYDLSKTNFDDYEIEYNYEHRYLKIDEFEKVLSDDINSHQLNKIIYPELIDVIREYLKNKE